MIWLASKSPRRKEILDQMGVLFKTIDVEVDESVLSRESGTNYVERVALAKAKAGWEKVEQSSDILISADTSVLLGERILGKPEDIDDARETLKKLSGKTHMVCTVVCAMTEGKVNLARSTSKVTFQKISTEMREAYLETRESLGKAGSYAIQGRAAQFISHIEGSYSGIVGLPIYETSQLLRQMVATSGKGADGLD